MMREDWERAKELEMMYLIEEQMRIEEEWEHFEEEQNRKPAIVEVINVPKEVEHEDEHNTFPFQGTVG